MTIITPIVHKIICINLNVVCAKNIFTNSMKFESSILIVCY